MKGPIGCPTGIITGAAGMEAGGVAECGTFEEGEAQAGGAWLVLQEISLAFGQREEKRDAGLPAFRDAQVAVLPPECPLR